MNFLYPKRLRTPYIKLGIPIEEGINILKAFNSQVTEENDKEHSFRINADEFDIAVYEQNNLVSAVWFNDPSGRIWRKGKTRKIKLYLERYGELKDWELRLDNGWMHYYFNDTSGVQMVYGTHNDVIRFNLLENA